MDKAPTRGDGFDRQQCPNCKRTFTDPMDVYRHLISHKHCALVVGIATALRRQAEQNQARHLTEAES